LLTEVSIVLLVDPMKETPERAVRIVALAHDGDEEHAGAWVTCTHSACPTIPPLSRPGEAIKIFQEGTSIKPATVRDSQIKYIIIDSK